MMIDCHVHTFYSKHATGTVDEVVRAALAKGVNVLTFTDHAPFHVDSLNRLLESELDQYFDDIERAQTEYRGQIKILRGLELDYLPGASDYTARMLARYDLDFAIGSIHYISMANGDEVKVWELARLNNPAVLKRYFSTLAELLECGLFDAVGHADTLLRGVSSPVVHRYVEPLLPATTSHSNSTLQGCARRRWTSVPGGKSTASGHTPHCRCCLCCFVRERLSPLGRTHTRQKTWAPAYRRWSMP
jgi:histidinol-phosphatase (PHP family)